MRNIKILRVANLAGEVGAHSAPPVETPMGITITLCLIAYKVIKLKA